MPRSFQRASLPPCRCNPMQPVDLLDEFNRPISQACKPMWRLIAIAADVDRAHPKARFARYLRIREPNLSLLTRQSSGDR